MFLDQLEVEQCSKVNETKGNSRTYFFHRRLMPKLTGFSFELFISSQAAVVAFLFFLSVLFVCLNEHEGSFVFIWHCPLISHGHFINDAEQAFFMHTTANSQQSVQQ